MSEELRQSLITELATDLARAIEAMTSEQPELSLSQAPFDDSEPRSTWRQKFNATAGSAWLSASTATWISLGTRSLRAAGIDDSDDESGKSTFVEILGQAFSMVARSLTGRTDSEWECTDGAETTELPHTDSWACIHLRFQDGTIAPVYAVFDADMMRDLSGKPGGAVVALPAGGGAHVSAASPLAEKSKTLELLLDVELPVSVSFGRAQLSLKDVIKLTTGSIVELNRTIMEPVEVIVNNCVIARGEVVVIEGNFGVRIQQVVSREERLRTLY